MGGSVEVDDIIARWVKSTQSVLKTGTPDDPTRYFHIPGEPPFECFQVVVYPPEKGRVSVMAAAIDTNDDTDAKLQQLWEGPIIDIDNMLGKAVCAIEAWKQRRREQPDPPSPW